jgi:methionyl-tRNA synthetase
MIAVLGALFVAIRDLAVSILPVIPASAGKLLDQMGVPEEERGYAALGDADSYSRLVASGFRLEPPKPIFPRLEMPGS